MANTPADAKNADTKIRELETKKLDLQAQIVSLKAEVFKVDRDLHQAGASNERINQLMRW